MYYRYYKIIILINIAIINFSKNIGDYINFMPMLKFMILLISIEELKNIYTTKIDFFRNYIFNEINFFKNLNS